MLLYLAHSLTQSIHAEGSCIPCDCRSLAHYAQELLEYTGVGYEAQPALWFRNIVDKRCPYGHVDHFLHPNAIVAAVRQAGFDVDYVEVPTPWIFPSADDFVYFFYEKFALGPETDSIATIPRSVRAELLAEAREYLGVQDLPGGAIAAGWRLGYYRIRKA